MPPQSKADLQKQRAKLVNSYQELLTEFSSKELQTVGNYHVGRLIGKGSFGKVYLATHKLTNGSKVVLKSAQKDDANLAREIHHHRQLLHPHITRLYEVIVTETLVWLVLEYCPGDELFNYLIKNGRLSTQKTKRIFTQLVGAVSYVHLNNCVHRDLKLENIMLDKAENVKLCDFGFTREYERNKLLQTFCGTVCYSAPEMLKGERYMAYAVDVWSLGVILYALLCGELPFDEDVESETKLKILNDEPKYPDDIPDDAVSLLKAMLQKKPSLRPTLSELLAHPFLAEHAPQQRAILAVQALPPFTTKLEKDCLHRMKAAGVDIDQVIENVLAKKCDALAGWWALLIEKEERKERRRQKKKIESRRMSAASQLDSMPPPVEEVDEDASPKRSNGKSTEKNPIIILPERPFAKYGRPRTPTSPRGGVPPPVEKDRDYGPYLKPPQSERQVRSSPDLRRDAQEHKNRTTRKQALMMQLASIKHWFLDSAKRATSPNAKSVHHHQNLMKHHSNGSKSHIYHQYANAGSSGSRSSHSGVRRNSRGNAPYITTHRNTPPPKRNSLSPQPHTPRSSYRRASAGRGLNGRNSTSSSVSSIRSFHNKTHSKASSTSSASISSINLKSPRSPRGSSVKVLPATPSSSNPFPSKGGVGRGGGYNESAVLAGPIAFAKRKKSVFKGPMLNGSSSSSKRDSMGSMSKARGGGNGGIIEEEEEEEEEVVDFGLDDDEIIIVDESEKSDEDLPVRRAVSH
ncbi:kinase-like domain-containing protein [Tricharina praecox]|uniref:kinase-like domain-containing protein n=1 Tax=Tricharina praecox TaxID=43433 RepID=UPI002220EF5B|nr:kinase-like domain-containing protein [Tricharina praecox]KAI5850085.1 kinase-like domain-containing protein [Tricharina praecox]